MDESCSLEPTQLGCPAGVCQYRPSGQQLATVTEGGHWHGMLLQLLPHCGTESVHGWGPARLAVLRASGRTADVEY